MDELTGEWRRLYKEELYDLYSSPNTIRGIRCRGKRCTRHVEYVGMRKGAYRVFVWEICEKNRPFGKSRCRWANNIRRFLQEMGWGVYWIYVAQVRDTC